MSTILSIVPYNIFPVKSGGQKAIALFNRYLAAQAKLVCVTVENNKPEFASNYTLVNILTNRFYRYLNLLYFFPVKKLVKQHQATHVLIEHPYYGWLGILLKTFTTAKLIVRSHNIESLRWKSLGKWWWKILWWYERATHRYADYNFFIQDDDKQYAVRYFGLDAAKCFTLLYGIEWNSLLPEQEIVSAKQQIRALYQIPEDEHILFFNGAFNYLPNAEALTKIIQVINPLLQQQTNFRYKIIICGPGLPLQPAAHPHPNMIFAGFVDDVGLYFKAADLFINPVTEGGGIKTKLVEALGHNVNAVSTVNGAIGVNPEWCNGKLFVSGNSDWPTFVQNIIRASVYKADLGPVYFQQFYWGYSIKKALAFINNA
jgi:glycosyltransferase involved in cell wall biosynthesis